MMEASLNIGLKLNVNEICLELSQTNFILFDYTTQFTFRAIIKMMCCGNPSIKVWKLAKSYPGLDFKRCNGCGFYICPQPVCPYKSFHPRSIAKHLIKKHQQYQKSCCDLNFYNEVAFKTHKGLHVKEKEKNKEV